MKYIVLIGRIFYSWIFLSSSIGHFTAKAAEHAASKGVPMAGLLVPISGVLALAGGLSVLLGLKAKFGGLLLVLFLVPVTLMMHNYWTITGDDMMRMQQHVNFNKNMALTGAALLISYFGAGPLSIDNVLNKPKSS